MLVPNVKNIEVLMLPTDSIHFFTKDEKSNSQSAEMTKQLKYEWINRKRSESSDIKRIHNQKISPSNYKLFNLSWLTTLSFPPQTHFCGILFFLNIILHHLFPLNSMEVKSDENAASNRSKPKKKKRQLNQGKRNSF
jgi:hypothetical protein